MAPVPGAAEAGEVAVAVAAPERAEVAPGREAAEVAAVRVSEAAEEGVAGAPAW
ncbi:hypothetical protein ACIP5L_07600 [Streptomyces bacillaris]|uniref:hypothetical protein n=1 Tax=Streptomyces bacillaris TaxID=68179 RepID=UPI00380933E6